MAARGQTAVLVKEQGAVLVCCKEARRNSVHADVAVCKVYRQPLREVRDRCLGTAVRRDLRQWRKRVHRGDIHNAAACFQHVGRKCLRRQQRAEKVQVEHERNAVLVKVKKRPRVFVQHIFFAEILARRGALRVVAACTVDEHLARAEFFQHNVMRLFQALFVQHIRLYGNGLTARLADTLRLALRSFQVEVKQCDFVPVCGKRAGKSAAKHAARAGNDNIHRKFLLIIT